MQGFERAGGSYWTLRRWPGTWSRRGSMFAFLAAHRAEMFPDADYADLFAAPGVGLLLLLVILRWRRC